MKEHSHTTGKVGREKREKRACRRCRKRKKKCTPLQWLKNGRKCCVPCDSVSAELSCEYISVEDDLLKSGKSSVSKGSGTSDISSNQEPFAMSPPFPSDNNSELEFLEFAWQLELEILDEQFIQSSPPTASSSSFPSLDTPATYSASRTTSSRSQSTHHATSRQDDYRLLYNASPADNQSADPPYLHPGGQHTSSFPSLGPPATYSHLPITSSWSQPPSYATLWQDNYRSQSQSLADNQSAHSSHLHPGGQHTSNFPSLGTPAIYNPFPTTLSRSQSTSHATPLQDDYRPLYNTSQSQPPPDNRYAHSLDSQFLNPGGQHMEYTPNYPSTGHGTPSAAPHLYQAPSQNEYFTNNGIQPPFDEESFTRRGALNPCPWCFRGIPHSPCHDAPRY